MLWQISQCNDFSECNNYSGKWKIYMLLGSCLLIFLIFQFKSDILLLLKEPPKCLAFTKSPKTPFCLMLNKYTTIRKAYFCTHTWQVNCDCQNLNTITTVHWELQLPVEMETKITKLINGFEVEAFLVSTLNIIKTVFIVT